MSSRVDNIRGASWILIATFFFSSMNAIAKGIPSAGTVEISAIQLTFARYCVAAVVLFPFVLSRPNLWHPSHLGRYFVRTVAGFGGIWSMFSAVQFGPLAEATAIGFTSPIFAVIFASMFLCEPLTRWRWVSVCLGMSGATLIVLARGGASFSLASVVPLLAAVCMGAELVSIKWLSRIKDHAVSYRPALTF